MKRINKLFKNLLKKINKLRKKHRSDMPKILCLLSAEVSMLIIIISLIFSFLDTSEKIYFLLVIVTFFNLLIFYRLEEKDMGLISKIKNWFLDKFLEKKIRINDVEVKLNNKGDLDTVRCCEAFKYLKKMVEEIEPELEQENKFHLYIIDVKKSSEGQFYITDDKYNSCICKFDKFLRANLYEILCKKADLKINDNSHFLKLESTADIELFVKKLIESAINNYKIDISPCQHYHFSMVKLGSIKGKPNFVRFYGIGCDEDKTKVYESSERESIYELFESMLSECIGFIESPTDRNVINTFKIKEEYAGKILKKYGVLTDSELITEIAATRYESEECEGNILFCNDANVKEPLIQFKEISLKSENIRAIRKYLEMAKKEYCLWAKKSGDEFCIYGIDKKEKAHKYILLQFTGYRKWSIQNDKHNILLERKGEKYFIPDIKKTDSAVRTALESLLSGNCNNLCNIEKNIIHLFDIVQAAKAQSHGTMIVFTHPNEAKKLTKYFSEKNRGIELKYEVDLIRGNDEDSMKKLLINLSSIDGALIIDTNGSCHAVGVILDGITEEKCNMARGARYNSALTFITNDNFEKIYDFDRKKCMIFVFSEDKTVNILSSAKNYT